ncbi:uncharacterized protein LOC111098955 isoform X1 [Canis lupus familiaris]|uniref:uncharacterized protein LOC111098955 isoform X1 n=1 Tax=Canis lupus familiaris TaxID=9615 RepID=UPI0018F5ED5D|nr:uncharacterized protein LOC111098955 isoform X1 [Canis lupus familiaris]
MVSNCSQRKRGAERSSDLPKVTEPGDKQSRGGAAGPLTPETAGAFLGPLTAGGRLSSWQSLSWEPRWRDHIGKTARDNPGEEPQPACHSLQEQDQAMGHPANFSLAKSPDDYMHTCLTSRDQNHPAEPSQVSESTLYETGLGRGFVCEFNPCGGAQVGLAADPPQLEDSSSVPGCAPLHPGAPLTPKEKQKDEVQPCGSVRVTPCRPDALCLAPGPLPGSHCVFEA